MTQEPKRQFDWDILGRLDERTLLMDKKLDNHMAEERIIWDKHEERVTKLEHNMEKRINNLEILSNRVKWTAAVVIAIPTVLTFTRDWIAKIFRRLFMPE